MSSKPLFFWNTPLAEMTEEGLREIVRRCYTESGYSGFGILPFWQEGYLSDRYFALYEAALEEGAKCGMKFSLYDENGFPSYTAGGTLCAEISGIDSQETGHDRVFGGGKRKDFLKTAPREFIGGSCL